MSRKLFAMVGCSKTKREKGPNDFHNAMYPARDMYTSELFKKRVSHVEGRNLPWMILSAKSGCLTPRTPIRFYDEVLKEKDPIDVAAWHVTVVHQFIDHLYYDWEIRDLKQVAVELHAGSLYCDPLDKILMMFGCEVIRPVAGMGIGQQLAYYSQEVVKHDS